MDDAGDLLLDLAASAKQVVTLIAPFAKVATVDRILGAISPEVPVQLYTRWRLDEIAAGVSDLGIWGLIQNRAVGSLHLCHHLHAKCYIFDETAAVGSANLTARALGWHSRSNLELQLAVPSRTLEVVSLLARLRRESTRVDVGIYEKFVELESKLSFDPLSRIDEVALPIVATVPNEVVESGEWLPYTRAPDQLFVAYKGDDKNLTSALKETTTKDLEYLSIPRGMSKEDFEFAVQTTLLQLPFFQTVATMSEEPRRFGEYRDMAATFIAARGLIRDPTDAWQTCLRWLLHFQGDRYGLLTPKYTEILTRRKD